MKTRLTVACIGLGVLLSAPAFAETDESEDLCAEIQCFKLRGRAV